MTWEEKYRGFICLIYLLLRDRIITLEDLDRLVGQIQKSIDDSPEIKYSSKGLKKMAVQIVQMLEN